MRRLLIALACFIASPVAAQTVLVGDPVALVLTTGSLTFDPAQGAATIPQHGYFNVRITTRTLYDNGCVLDDQAWLPFWSNLDPTAPITTPPENKIMLATVADLTCPNNNAALFGQHVVEMREQAPLYNQLANTTTLSAFGYNYQCCLPPGTYEVRVNPNLHMGIDGVLLPGTILDGQPLTPGGPPRPLGSGNLDTLDPAVVAAAPPKMGNAPGDVTLGLNWIVPVPAGFVDQWGGTEPKVRLDAWLNFDVHLNPVPAPTGDVWTLHDNPWGVTSVAKTACPKPDFQAHYGATAALETALNPDLSHTHINPTVCPYSEVKGGDQVTIPFTLKLYKTAGRIISVGAQFMGPNGPVNIPVSIGSVVAPPPPPPPPPVPTVVTVPVIGQLVNGVPQVCVVMPDSSLRCVAVP